MMSNFAFLSQKPAYAAFSAACIEAEKVCASSPAMCALGCRKALELAIKWVYAADSTISAPYRDNLQSLLHEYTFRSAVEPLTWSKLPYIVRLGNLAAHTAKSISRGDAEMSLANLFEFVEWIDYCYGSDYEERKFDEKLIPAEKVKIDEKKLKAQDELISQKNSEIAALLAKVEAMSAQFTAGKASHKNGRRFDAGDISEFLTRKKYIDVDLKLLGWTFGGDVREEYEVADMAGAAGQPGFADYVLFGQDGLPLAVIEAKRTSRDPNIGREQAKLYADALEKKFGRRPMMFTSNGFETYFWDDRSGPQRVVSGFFSSGDLQKLMDRREQRRDLGGVQIDQKITDRYYQLAAVKAVCENISGGYRKSLLVMATGTGKTRVSASIADVLSRGGWATNVLFLADRTVLVQQAKDAFKNYLPDMSLCNLLSNKDDKNARVVFSTYPTMLNAIDSARTDSGGRLFTPAHFDLIIVDEAHRSIFKKYRAIFDYFDALLVGLTATPKNEVDRNTYDFFDLPPNVPTYAYDYETAVYTDHVLVPYYNLETSTKFLSEGIVYDQLSEEDKARYEDDFAEDAGLPDFIPSSELNTFVFNKDTVDRVLQDLMEKGVRTEGGDRLGKTIIFAQTKKHAEYILERFNALYPSLKGGFAKRVICDDSYAQTIITDFKQPHKEPVIAVSVDMMDTGIDVPEIVNLVFFKKVRSKTKFWQMIGRGTRLCPTLECVDGKNGAYTDKKCFYIFDYCDNFEYFRTDRNETQSSEIASLSEAVFKKRVRIVQDLQDAAFADEWFQSWRQSLISIMTKQIQMLNTELISVKLQLRYVEKFRDGKPWVCLSDQDRNELELTIAPLVSMDDKDEYAKRFDNFMYGMMIAKLENLADYKKYVKDLVGVAAALSKKATIPQIKEKLPLIKSIDRDYCLGCGAAELENIRAELRGLINFLVEKGKFPIFTDLTDEFTPTEPGRAATPGFTSEEYRKKVDRYIEEHKDNTAIYKLRNNIPLSSGDYQALSEILTHKLGSGDDYAKAFGDTPFGLMIRRVAKLEREAAMKVFSRFIAEQALDSKQIRFVDKIVNYVVENGYMDDVDKLLDPPFDKPQSFVKLFDAPRREKIISLVRQIKDNATKTVA